MSFSVALGIKIYTVIKRNKMTQTGREQLNAMPDEKLVALSNAGNKDATECLLVRYLNMVRGIARGFFLVGGDTDDLSQEGMIGLYQAINEYKIESKSTFKTFAYLCVYRRIVDGVKRFSRKKNDPLNDSLEADESIQAYGLSPEELMIVSEEKRELKQAMSKVLSDFEYKVTMLYVDGMTSREICNATGKTLKSVDNAIQRSKRKLQEFLQGEGR